MSTVIRLGDVEFRPEEAIELPVKTSKCTALCRAKGWKKFGKRERADEGSSFADRMQVDKSGDEEEDEKKVTYAQLVQRTEFFVDRSKGEEGGDEGEEDGEGAPKVENVEKVEKEQLVRGFKYGSTYVPCPEGQFARMTTRRGINILGFFKAENVRLRFFTHLPSYWFTILASFAMISRWVRFNTSGRILPARSNK
jgi:ATP-dependent DNA helicase 2 subunit 2